MVRIVGGDAALPLIGNGKTVTVSTPLVDLTQTWNNAGVTFTAFRLNVTDTASAAASLLFNFQVGGVSMVSARKSGDFTIGGAFTLNGGITTTSSNPALNAGGNGWILDGNNATQARTTGFSLASGSSVAWTNGTSFSGTLDLFLRRGAANQLSQRNSTAAQSQQIFNTFTDPSNGEWVTQGWSANRWQIETDRAGTGLTRGIRLVTVGASPIEFATTNTVRWLVDGSGNFIANADNAYDIGASGANRPRSIYVGTSITAGGGISASGNIGGNTLSTSQVAVAGLQTCNAGARGIHAFVTDATQTLTAGIGTVVAGGGANPVPVVCDGANWRIG